MLENGILRSTSDELEQEMEQEIKRRTGRRVRQLGVKVTGNQVRVRGCCLSYYDKQLALHAILDSFASMAVVLDIDVVGSILETREPHDAVVSRVKEEARYDGQWV